MVYSVIAKQTDGAVLGRVQVDPALSVAALIEEVEAALEHAFAIRALVHRGRVMLPTDVAGEVFLGLDSPIVYIVRASQQAHPASSQQQGAPLPAPQQQEAAVPASEQMCRICFGDSATERLFRPCLCRGSSAYVHLSCLNAWRERPENPGALRQCSVCGYEYRLARARFARRMLGEDFAQVLAGLCLAGCILVAGLVVNAVLPAEWSDALWDFAELQKPSQDWVQRLVVGTAVVGGAGFALHLTELWEFVRDAGSINALASLGLMLAANGPRGLRLFSLAGLATAFYFMHETTRIWARRAAMRWGERVMAFGET
jgi:hypothetical protein